MTPAELRERLSADPAAATLRLAVLHGSQARADAAEGSDWDIGVLADDRPDLPALSATLAASLGTDNVDVVDLRRTSALLRYRAARDGIPLLERPSGEFQRFQLEAVQFWCDTETVIRAAHDDVLAARMSDAIDRELLAERAAAVDRHLRRVAEHLPRHAGDLQPLSMQTDAVVLHLWQAVQVVIDLAVSSCVRLGLGSPPTYADAFQMLAGARLIPGELAQRLGRAAGFRNLVVHAYAELDLRRLHTAATSGPADLRAFLAALRDHAGAE